MEKPLIFISHITEEKELAISFKELIEEKFLGMIEVFVSSDENSISLGDRWLNSISDSLKKCKIELILCSPKSVKRPWINFEAGAGWVRDISVIPLCHSGMKPSDLPMPLNLLQAIEISSVPNLKLLFPVIAQAIGSAVPTVDFTDFVTKAKELELQYSFWDVCNQGFGILNSVRSDIIPTLKQNNSMNTMFKETDINQIEKFKDYFFVHNLLELSQTQGSTMNGRGTFYNYSIKILPNLLTTINDPNFKY